MRRSVCGVPQQVLGKLLLQLGLAFFLLPLNAKAEPYFADSGTHLAALGAGAAAVADFNSDGKEDIAITGCNEGTCESQYTKLLRNNGDGSFTELATAIPAQYQSSLAWADYNKDSRPDLLMSGCLSLNLCNQISTKLYQNKDGASFEPVSSGLPDMWDAAVAWGDYDANGYPDVLMAGATASSFGSAFIYRNQGNGTFVNSGVSLPGLNSHPAVAWADYNKDGRLDFSMTGYAPDLGVNVARIYRQESGGGFTDIGAALLGVSGGSLVWTDFDRDSYPDLLVIGADDAFNLSARLYRNNNAGGFALVNGTSLPGTMQGSVSVADFDNDTFPDVLITGNGASGLLSKVYRNNGGSGTFSEIETELVPIGFRSGGFWGDFNGDGYSDILLVGDTALPFVGLYHNTAPPSLRGVVMELGVGLLPGIRVVLGGTANRSVYTDQYGMYRFVNLANGPYTINPQSDAFTFTPQSRQVTIQGTSMEFLNFQGVRATPTSTPTPTATTPAPSPTPETYQPTSTPTASTPGPRAVLPDLAVKFLKSPKRIAAGRSYMVKVAIANDSDADASSFRVGIFLVKAKKRQLLSAQDVASLGAGKAVRLKQRVRVPKALKSGTYYFEIRADIARRVREASESNNSAKGPSAKL